MRKKIIAGNWKMNMLPNEAIEFIQKLEPLVTDTNNEVILCVPYTDLFYALLTAQQTNIKIGAQNMHFEEKGAYTGEVSAEMLKSINVEYVIIGHSERRAYFAETDETVNKKLKSALKHELKPIVCVGETLESREAGETKKIITTQTRLALEGINSEDVEKVIDLGFVTKNYEIYTNKLKEMIDSGELDKKIEEREKIEKDVANGVFSAMKDIRKREINGKK